MHTIHSRVAHKFGRRRKNEIITRELTNKPAAATKLGWPGKSPSVICGVGRGVCGLTVG